MDTTKMETLFLFVAIHLVVPATLGQRFEFTDDIQTTHSCGVHPKTTWTSEGSVFLTETDLTAFDQKVDINANMRLCSVDLTQCPPNNFSATSECVCLSREGDKFQIRIGSTTTTRHAGMNVQVVVPGRGGNSSIFGAVDIGTLPTRPENGSLVQASYRVNDGTSHDLLEEQTLGFHPGQRLLLEVCVKNGNPRANLRLKVGEMTNVNVGKCIEMSRRLMAGQCGIVTFEYTEPGPCRCTQRNVFILKDNVHPCTDEITTAATPMAQTTPTTAPVIEEGKIAGICPDSPRFLETLPSGEQTLTYQEGNSSWTVFQRRHILSNSTDFNRDWESYETGFGKIGDEFWLGLKPVHSMCNSTSPCELLVNLGYPGEPMRVPKQMDGCYFAHYKLFYLDGPEHQYKLHVGGYSGSAGDSMGSGDDSDDGDAFSTPEKNNARAAIVNCADEYHSGWWYHACGLSGLNSPWGEHLWWYTLNAWLVSNPPLSYTDMMVKMSPTR